MKLVVGLGNPGTTYARTRHNLGFRVVTALAKGEGISLKRSIRIRADLGEGEVAGEQTTLLLPGSYMNRSGPVVGRWLSFRKMPLSEMLVVLDDLQLPLGQLRVREGGSDGGHQGLKSLIDTLGSGEFARLRIGIGSSSPNQPWEAFVLQPFRRSEEPLVNAMVKQAADCCRVWVSQGTRVCANQFNARTKDKNDRTL